MDNKNTTDVLAEWLLGASVWVTAILVVLVTIASIGALVETLLKPPIGF